MVFNLFLHLYDLIVIDFGLFYEVKYLVIIKKITPIFSAGWNFMKKFYEFHLNLRHDFFWWLIIKINIYLLLCKMYYYCCTTPISFYLDFFLNIRIDSRNSIIRFLIWKITGKDRLSVHFCTFGILIFSCFTGIRTFK